MTLVVSFYSYKGGVGRSLSLANVAALLAHKGWRVGCIDFDLEAGGLHTIFNVEQNDIDFSILDLLIEPNTLDIRRATIDLIDYLSSPPPEAELFLLPAVTQINKVQALAQISEDISSLPSRLNEVVKQFINEYLPHVVLIDSRSGFSDFASLAITQADCVVCVMRPNRQNADGLRLFLDVQSNLQKEFSKLEKDIPETFLVLSQVPDSPRAGKYIKELTHLLGKGRSFGTQIPYDPEMALQEYVIAAKDPNSNRTKNYIPIVEWIERRLE